MRMSKEVAIDIILKEMDQGRVLQDVKAMYFDEWNISDSSFNNYWREAREIHRERRQIIEEELLQYRIKKEKEYLDRNIISIQGRREWLTNIITAKTDLIKKGRSYFEVIRHPDGREEIITVQDKQRAVQELNKMDGAYAPNRVHVGEDKDVKEIDYSKLSNNTLEELLKQLEDD